MYGEALRLLRREWLPVTAATVAGLTAAAVTTHVVAGLFRVGPAIAFLLWLVTIDAARTYVLIRVSGKEAGTGRIAKRVCIDLGFVALLGLILLVIPLTEAFAVYTGRTDVAVAVGLLWYYFLALYVVLLVDLFYMGYLVAVEDRSVEEALVESARRFRKDKGGTVKRAVKYWAPAALYVAGNILTGSVKGPLADAVAWGTVVVTAVLVVPLMEAAYVVACRMQ